MKKSRILPMILSLLLLLTLGQAESLAFKDIRNHWAQDYIDNLSSENLINGYNDGSFKPNNNMTRVEFYTIINKLANLEKTYAVSFSDVKRSDWFHDEVAKGIKGGYIFPTTGRLNPERNITREEVMEIIARVYGLSPKPAEVEIFNDKTQISDRAKGYIGALIADGVVEGYRNNTIEPKRTISRGEVSKIIVAAIDKYGYPKANSLSDSEIVFGSRNLYD